MSVENLTSVVTDPYVTDPEHGFTVHDPRDSRLRVRWRGRQWRSSAFLAGAAGTAGPGSGGRAGH